MSHSGKEVFEVAAGSIHYIDTQVGSAGTVVFVHGNPASSAEFVPAIEQLRTTHRCIAIDHIGFGDSSKPARWDYLPSSHAQNLARLLDHLDLGEVTLVVGDWGGPIGLSWAIDNPDRVRNLVVCNTWLWPVNRSLYYQGFSKAMGGPLGRYLIRKRNLFATQVVKRAWGTRTPLTPKLHSLFTSVHTAEAERKGMWVFPKEIVGSSAWLAKLWERRSALNDMNITLLWGMKDIAFRPKELEYWIAQFPDSKVVRLADVGHFVALEATQELVHTVRV